MSQKDGIDLRTKLQSTELDLYRVGEACSSQNQLEQSADEFRQTYKHIVDEENQVVMRYGRTNNFRFQGLVNGQLDFQGVSYRLEFVTLKPNDNSKFIEQLRLNIIEEDGGVTDAGGWAYVQGPNDRIHKVEDPFC